MSDVTKRPREDVIEDATEKKTKVESVLSSEDENKIAKLLAFYFSDSNLRNDKFLKSEQAKDNGYVQISVLLTFNKLKSITSNSNDIINVVKNNENLKELIELNEMNNAIKRIQPISEKDDSPLRTIYVEGYSLNDKEPEIESIMNIFNIFGEILLIRKRRGVINRNEPKKFIGSVFIEFKDFTSAEKAVETHEFKIPNPNANSATQSSTDAPPAAAEEDAPIVPEELTLRVMMLNQWLEKNQKAKDEEHQARQRGQGKKRENSNEADENNEKDENEKEPVYDCGKILKLSSIPSDIEIDRFAFKDYFNAFGKVKYVDFNNGDNECFIRFDTSEEATNALTNINDKNGLSLNLIQSQQKSSDKIESSSTEMMDPKNEKETSSSDVILNISLVEGEEEKSIWRNIDIMHKQNMSGKGGKKGKGKGKGKKSRH